MSPEVIGSLVTSGVSLVIAFVSWLTSYFYKRKSSSELQKAVTDSVEERLDNAFVECPTCHAQHSLDSLEISFPPVSSVSKISVKEVVNNGKEK